MPSARPRKAARAAVALLALGAAGLTAAASTPGIAGAHATAAAGIRPCVSAGSADRVRADSVGTTTDPNDLTPAQTSQMDARMHARLAHRRLSLQRSSTPSRQVDVYVHVIEKSNGKGGVSTTRIKKQISVLNSAYAGKTSSSSTATGFTFKLKKIDRTKNSGWYSWSSPEFSTTDDTQAKTKLHKGGADDLNLYVTSLQDGLLGYATFPDQVAAQPKLDGVVVLNASLPGGSAKGRTEDGTLVTYNLGDTATHEVGHWLGLLHTFEGDCQAPGDEVADTPAQDYETSDFTVCADADTCAADPGHDPIHNFMNYADDKCLNRFTPGQAARMVQFWNAYRVPVSPA